MKQEDIDSELLFEMIKSFKNHADVNGWPSESFRKKVKKYLKQNSNENDTIRSTEK
jgi:hypothetical protein